MPQRLIGVHDALTATVATRLNADGLWLGSLSVSLSLGVPDEGLVTAEDYRERIVAIRRVSSLPILVDIDVGCLRANSVTDVVSTLAAAGANGVAIEDKAYPKVNSFRDATQQLIPVSMFLTILTTALSSRPDMSFAIVARSDALVAGLDTKETVRLITTYQGVGIDGVLLQSKNPDPADLCQVLELIRRDTSIQTIGVIPTAYPQIKAATWLDHGASVVIYANQLLRASVPAMVRTATSILSAEGRQDDSDMVAMQELFDLSGQNA